MPRRLCCLNIIDGLRSGGGGGAAAGKGLGLTKPIMRNNDLPVMYRCNET
jgi:hypothetical protein